jgi:L-fucose isomerase-like protein
LTSDYDQLAAGIRPIRAIHHLREAAILDVTTRLPRAMDVITIKRRYGTDTKIIDRSRVLAAYEAVPEADARAEAERWITNAQAVVEPPKDEIVRSCRLALAFERLLNEENATVMTIDCYGSMFQQLPAYPCIGFTRLNNMGLGGICEADLQSAMTHIIFQGLVGRPGFISDPTMDVSRNATILAHCLGTTKMDGPDGPAAPYKLRSIMERQEGVVPQVQMRVGQKVTQAKFIVPNTLLYYTGRIIEVPESERGCRTKITVEVDGDAKQLWKNWTQGLHRVTCYGDLTDDLKRFCRLADMRLINEMTGPERL